jgi:hypothetical protein
MPALEASMADLPMPASAASTAAVSMVAALAEAFMAVAAIADS